MHGAQYGDRFKMAVQNWCISMVGQIIIRYKAKSLMDAGFNASKSVSKPIYTFYTFKLLFLLLLIYASGFRYVGFPIKFTFLIKSVFFYFIFKYVKCCSLHHIIWQTIPHRDYPVNKKILSDIKVQVHVKQFKSVPSGYSIM